MEEILLFTKQRAAMLLGPLPFRRSERKEVEKPADANMQMTLFKRTAPLCSISIPSR